MDGCGRRLAVLVISAAVCAMMPSVSAADPGQADSSRLALSAGSAPDRVTLVVKGAGIREAVEALGRTFAFEVTNLDRLDSSPVEAVFTDAPVETVLESLLRRARMNFVLMRRAATGLPSKLLLSPGRSDAAPAAPASAAAPVMPAAEPFPAMGLPGRMPSLAPPEPVEEAPSPEPRARPLDDFAPRDMGQPGGFAQSYPMPAGSTTSQSVAPPVPHGSSLGIRAVTADEVNLGPRGVAGAQTGPVRPPIPPAIAASVQLPGALGATATATTVVPSAPAGQAASTAGNPAGASKPGVVVPVATQTAAPIPTASGLGANAIQQPTGPIPMNGPPPGTPVTTGTPTPPIPKQ
jgi:hypothetical protein